MSVKIRTMQAQPGKVFAYQNQETNEEIVLGSTLYLGINDDGSRYYEIDEPKEAEDDRQDNTN